MVPILLLSVVGCDRTVPTDPTPIEVPAVLVAGPSCYVSSVNGRECCKVCSTGKACGDTCISRDKICSKGEGCACDAVEVDATLKLICTTHVERGGSVECRVSVDPATATLEVGEWSFSGEGHQANEQSTAISWIGPAVVGGTVTVRALANGQEKTQSAWFTVSPRIWRWEPGGRQGNPGEIDSCFTAGQAGLTSGQSCTAASPSVLFTPVQIGNGAGYTARQIPMGGPNGGQWYIGSATATMQLRTQLHREFRSDGPTYPMVGDPKIVGACTSLFGTAAQKTGTVNTQCQQVQRFVDFVDFVWAHEDRHMKAGLAEAKQPGSDVHLLWEPLVSGDEAGLAWEALRRYNVAHARITDAALSTHTGNAFDFEFWRNLSGGWTWALTRVRD